MDLMMDANPMSSNLVNITSTEPEDHVKRAAEPPNVITTARTRATTQSTRMT